MGFILFPIIKNKIKKHKGVMKLKKKNWKKRRIEETNISWLSKKKKKNTWGEFCRLEEC